MIIIRRVMRLLIGIRGILMILISLLGKGCWVGLVGRNSIGVILMYVLLDKEVVLLILVKFGRLIATGWKI